MMHCNLNVENIPWAIIMRHLSNITMQPNRLRSARNLSTSKHALSATVADFVVRHTASEVTNF